MPPSDSGFGGTALFDSVSDAELIEELIRRGYARVERKEPEA